MRDWAAEGRARETLVGQVSQRALKKSRWRRSVQIAGPARNQGAFAGQSRRHPISKLRHPLNQNSGFKAPLDAFLVGDGRDLTDARSVGLGPLSRKGEG
jgi:hypothetical protein